LGLSVEKEQPKPERPKEIYKRSFAYSLRAVKLYRFLQERRAGAGWVLGKQYLRAATSVGANIEEAQAAETKSERHSRVDMGNEASTFYPLAFAL